jgi:hypothetical protein
MARHTTNFGIVCVVVVLVIKELGCKHNAGDKDTMDIQRVDDE